MSTRLLVDLGGTNARLALVGAEGFRPGTPVVRLPVAAYAGFGDLLADWREGPGRGVAVAAAAVAAAGPVEAGRIALTNLPWTVEAAAVSAALGGAAVRLLNDLEAVALALPALGEGAAEVLRPGSGAGPRLALNVGTGLGGAVAVPLAAGWTALAAEPGHMRFGAVTEAERALLPMVATVEDLVSGRGIAELYRRLAGHAAAIPADAVLARARTDPIAAAVRDLMLAALGRVAGDLVLATGAWGGVWLCGGVASAWERDWTAAILGPFEAKGPMRARMAQVAIRRITHPEPALVGLDAALAGAQAPDMLR